MVISLISSLWQRYKQLIPIVLLVGAGVIACFLPETPSELVDTPSETVCPYPTDTQPCPYQWNR